MTKVEYIICGDINVTLFGNYNEQDLANIRSVIESVEGYFGSNMATQEIVDGLDQYDLNMPFFKENKMIVFWRA